MIHLIVLHFGVLLFLFCKSRVVEPFAQRNYTRYWGVSEDGNCYFFPAVLGICSQRHVNTAWKAGAVMENAASM